MFGADFHAALQAELARIQKRSFKLPFNAFPQEIKSHIISFVSSELQDLKNVRLVSHSLAETAAPFLFKELLLMPWKIGRFRDQRSLQTVQPHVRDLIFYDAVLPMITLEDWTGVDEVNRPLWLPNDMRTRFIRYQDLYSQQERNLKDIGNSEIVMQSMISVKNMVCSLRSLKVVTFDYNSWSYDERLDCRSLRELYDIWRDVHGLNLWRISQHSPLIHPKLWTAIMDALAGSEGQLANFSFNNIPHGMLEALETPTVRRLPVILDLFKSLVCVDLEIKLEFVDFQEQESPLKLITECLSAAKNLEDLSLNLYHHNSFPGDNPDILAHLSLSTRRLKKLRLGRMHTTPKSVLLLLLEHYKTLEKLEIDDISLWNSGIPTHQDDLRVTILTLATELHMEWIYVDCAYDDGWGIDGSYQVHVLSLNAPQRSWEGERIETWDVDDFCSKLHSKAYARTFLGLQAVCKR